MPSGEASHAKTNSKSRLKCARTLEDANSFFDASWDVMRPLYISMLKVFLENCSDEDVRS